MRNAGFQERTAVVVVGAGQAGLAVGYHLRQRRIDHQIVDAGTRIGESWRSRWDSLRLFTPAQYDGLPGLPFPAVAGSFPTKDEMADYLEQYVERFSLPVRLGARVDQVSSGGDGYLVRVGARTLRAGHVVVAVGACRTRQVPAFA